MTKLLETIRTWPLRRQLARASDEAHRYTIRAATSDRDYLDALRLVHATYVSEGIARPSAAGIHVNPQHATPDSVVLCAFRDGRLVGTCTATADSPTGLPLDDEFPDEVERFRRAPETRLFEVNSLAIVRRERRQGLMWLLGLAALRVGSLWLGGTRIVIGVHPRARPVYLAAFAMRPFTEARNHHHLVDAPVVGLSVAMDEMHAYLRRHFPRRLRIGATWSELAGASATPPQSMPSSPSRQEAVLPREHLRAAWERPTFRRKFDHRAVAHLRAVRRDETLAAIGLDRRAS